MGTSKNELFRVDQNEIATLANAFGHPARIAILQHIIQAKNCINGDLVKELGLAQATISQHLKKLKEAGFIRGSIEGAAICYCINEEKWKKTKQLFIELFDQSACCEDDCC
jgi:ArsR family transcriptional regulator, lead/cadmium/zinc/bismuth-responsive transcriptional repressor